MTRIAIEATGCDEGFATVLEGAKRALERNSDLELTLVAGEDKLPKEYHNLSKMDGINLEKTRSTYDPNNKKVQTENSIYRAINMHKSGDVDAVIAPGSTKATASYAFRLLDKIAKFRPAIACNFSNNVLIDAGANRYCRAQHYVQFAIMGNVLSKCYLGIDKPLVGIMNITEEDSDEEDIFQFQKGKSLLDRLRNEGYNISDSFFEPNIFWNPKKGFRKGLVAVTNGTIANIMLKTAETCFEIGGDLVASEYSKEPFYSKVLGAIPFKRIYNRLKRKIDYRSFAVAPLLGYDSNIMICHGRSDEEAIQNAILITDKYLKCNINERLKEEIERCY